LVRSWKPGTYAPIWSGDTPVNLSGPAASEMLGSMRGVGAPCCQPLIIELSLDDE
jgi:hypothetical protein